MGLGAARIRRLFRQARKAAPAIVFIDELDAVGATRGKDISGEKDQTLNQLLVELDGFGDRDDVVVIAASNMLEQLDPALLRPGRFDRQILVTPPDLKGRRAILDVHTATSRSPQDVDLDLIARQTSGLSGADLANICNEAAIFAGRNRRDLAPHARLPGGARAGDRRHAVAPRDHRPTRSAWWPTTRPATRSAPSCCPSVERVHRISIIPRGQALGYTLNLPEEDRYLKTKDELIDYMVVLLGGRVTEHLVFGQVTTGASDDLRKVHEISRSMVTQYGMGTELQSKQLPADDYSMSEHTRAERGRGAAVPHRPGPPPCAQAGGREPRAARGLRLHAARERGARARGHRRDRGRLPRRTRRRTWSSCSREAAGERRRATHRTTSRASTV